MLVDIGDPPSAIRLSSRFAAIAPHTATALLGLVLIAGCEADKPCRQYWEIPSRPQTARTTLEAMSCDKAAHKVVDYKLPSMMTYENARLIATRCALDGYYPDFRYQELRRYLYELDCTRTKAELERDRSLPTGIPKATESPGLPG